MSETFKNEDGSWSIKTDWGESKGYPYEAYWILYGRKVFVSKKGVKIEE